MSDSIWTIGDKLLLMDSNNPWFTKFDKLCCVQKHNQLSNLQHDVPNNEQFANMDRSISTFNISNKHSFLLIFLIILLAVVLSL